MSEHPRNPEERLPRIARVGRAAWSVLGVVGVAIVAWLVVSYLAAVVVPVVLAVFVAAALMPVVDVLQRWHIPRPIAAFLAVLATLALVGGVLTVIVPAFVSQLGELGRALAGAAEQLGAYLASTPFFGPQVDVQAIAKQAASHFFGGGSIPTALGTAVTVLASVILLIVVVLFYLAEGRWLASGVVSWLPEDRQPEVWQVATRIWDTVGRYFRALLVVALFDALLIGLGLFILNVPLALPLAVLVYVGAFLPYIGAVVSGLLAVMVALAERGLVTAIIVLALVLVVQQIEGNVIQPLVMGQLVRLPAFVVLVAIAIGAALLGVLGAFLAVPVASVAALVLRHVSDRLSRPQPGG